MYHRRRRQHRFLVNDRVRACVELLEQDPSGPGFTLAAVVYGDDKEQAIARADLVAIWMTVEGSRRSIRRRLRWASIYVWAQRRHLSLLAWLVGCFVDTDTMGEWLRDSWPNDAVRRRLEGR